MPTGAAVLALGGALLLVLAALLGRRARSGVPRSMRPLLSAFPDALGDAALLLDREGRIVAANGHAVRLAGLPAHDLCGRTAAAVLGDDLEVLHRTATRGPASGMAAVRAARGEERVQAAIARVAVRPVRFLLVLRAAPAAPRPPPLPAPEPPPVPARRATGHADLAALSAALRHPTGEAMIGASMLRLLLPGDAGRASAALERVERALAELERRLAAIASAGAPGPGSPRALDLGAIVSDVLGANPAARGVRVRAALAPARALADEARLRGALREVLREAIGALPAGGELDVAVGQRGATAFVELGAGAVDALGDAVAIARALLAPEGGRVEVEAVPGRGLRCRIALPIATAAAVAPA